MAREDNQDETQTEAEAPDEVLLLKKRARRRLIGAAALALLAAVILPMVMDHEPAPPLKDIQVRIPSPDEGLTQRIAPVASKPVEAKPEAVPEPKSEIKPIRPLPVKPLESALISDEKPSDAGEKSQTEAKSDTKSAEWEVQLGAYQEAGRIKRLLDKLKDLGVPAYTERVTTPNGVRTRVRAGPFPSREAADKARERVKIIGVDGPVAQKQ